MYKCKSNCLSSLVPLSITKRSYDVSGVSEYGINASGFIRSDFAELQERQDASSLARLLSRFVELKEDDSNKNLSDEQIFDLLRPRVLQTPAELDRFEQYCIERGVEFARSLLHDPVKKDIVNLSSGGDTGIDAASSNTSSSSE